MKRREFIKTGAAGAAVVGAAGMGAVGAASCTNLLSGLMPPEALPPLPDMDPYLARVDGGLEAISSWKVADDFDEAGGGLGSDEEELLRKCLRSMYLAGMFGDLSEAGQVHPGMQARVRQALPEMDEAVFGMRDYLAGIAPDEANEVQEYLGDESDPGMEIAEWLDRRGKAEGVSTERRMHTRSMMTQVVSRLRNQPPRSLFDEYVGHVDRLAAQAGSQSEMQRQMIARMGKEQFFAQQQRLAMYAAAWQEEGATAEEAPTEDLPPVEFPEPDEVDAGAPDAGAPETDASPAADQDRVGMTPEEVDALVDESVRETVGAAAQDPSEQDKLRKIGKAGAWCLGIGGGLAGLTGLFVALGLFAVGPLLIASFFVGTAAIVVLLCGLIALIVKARRQRRLERTGKV